MMFGRSEEIRNNLLRQELKSDFSKEASLYFLSCLVSGNLSLEAETGVLLIDNEALFSRLSFLCRKLIKNYNCIIGNGIDFNLIYDYFCKKNYGNLTEMTTFVLKEDVYKSCIRSFFEIYGHISSTEVKDRYVEIYHNNKSVLDSYGELLKLKSISYGICKRRNNFVLYIKKFESICDYLAIIGDMADVLKFQVSKTDIEVSTQINRTYYFDLAGIEKTRKNALKEIEIINEIYKKIGKSSLPEGLSQLCELRLNNPEASYEELGELHVPSISKSSVSLKFKKIKNLL